MWERLHPGRVAVIVGGAVAGAEVVGTLTSRGVYCVVLERAAVPWGKIEWGLPKWHVKLRRQEEDLIDSKLMNPYVQFLPKTALGRDVQLEEILAQPVDAVFLAVGAWRDRPLPVPGVDEYVGRGFAYQNAFVAWYNETPDPLAEDGDFQIVDGAGVIGGGLASIDVVKIFMLETTRKALRERGLEVDVVTLEKKGIPRTLEQWGLRWEDLGLRGCTLYYRRRAEDMPLVPVEGNPTPEQEAQLRRVRVKVLETARNKYLFNFVPCSLPVDKIVEEDRLVGLVFQRTEVRDGKARRIAGSEFAVRAPLFVSSIGSLPEPLPGLPAEGNLYALEERESCRVKGFPNVFAVGNAVTGRGNIRVSRQHARQVASWVLDHFWNWQEADQAFLRRLLDGGDPQKLVRWAEDKGLRSVEELEELLRWVRRRQREVGYTGDYQSWVEQYRARPAVAARG